MVSTVFCALLVVFLAFFEGPSKGIIYDNICLFVCLFIVFPPRPGPFLANPSYGRALPGVSGWVAWVLSAHSRPAKSTFAL